MTGPFDGAWLKWAWATVHAQTLETEIDAFGKQGNGKRTFTLQAQYEPNRHCILWRIESIDQFPSEWGLRLGDVIHNYRSCLDHLAWALVQRGQKAPLTEGQSRQVYFPVATTREAFNQVVSARLPGLRRADLATVRRYQPYQVGKRRVAKSTLAGLAALSNADKHRTIQPALAFPTSARVNYSNVRDCVITRVTKQEQRPMQVGTEIHRVYVRKTGPDPYADMQLHFDAQPAIADSQFWLGEWITNVGQLTAKILSDFATPPDQITTLGLKVRSNGRFW